MIGSNKFFITGDLQEIDINILEKMMKLISKDENLSLKYYENVIIGEGLSPIGLSRIQVSLNTLVHDLDVENLLIIITPLFHPLLINLLSTKGIKLGLLIDDLIIAMKKGIDLSFLKEIFANVPSDTLETVANYIRFNQSVQIVSETMFTHRNTINYRINKFISITDINIHELINCNFVYFVLKIIEE